MGTRRIVENMDKLVHIVVQMPTNRFPKFGQFLSPLLMYDS